MTTRNLDAAGHHVAENNGGAMASGATGTTVAGTIVPTASAGATPTITFPANIGCNDRRGTYLLSPVTGGGAQAAGITSRVFFAQPYATPPASVQITGVNTTDTTVVAGIGATNITQVGFDVVTPLLVTAKVYSISYNVEV